MKYCKKCGMLLEDNMERCIGCGSDVTDKKSYSRFPEPVQKQLDSEKKESGKKYLAVFAITLVFIAILLMIGIFLSQTALLIAEQEGEGPATGMFTQMLLNSKKDKDGEQKKNRKVKDENGAYYKYTVLQDFLIISATLTASSGDRSEYIGIVITSCDIFFATGVSLLS